MSAEFPFDLHQSQQTLDWTASGLFEENHKLDKVEPPDAVAAFDDAFGRIATGVSLRTVRAL
jgi:hypothetical protein